MNIMDIAFIRSIFYAYLYLHWYVFLLVHPSNATDYDETYKKKLFKPTKEEKEQNITQHNQQISRKSNTMKRKRKREKEEISNKHT